MKNVGRGTYTIIYVIHLKTKVIIYDVFTLSTTPIVVISLGLLIFF